MTSHDYIVFLAKEAAKTTARTNSIKVNKPGGAELASKALHEGPESARQLPWRYGEKRRATLDPAQTDNG